MPVPGFLGPKCVPQGCAVWLVGTAGRGFRELLQPPDEGWPRGGSGRPIVCMVLWLVHPWAPWATAVRCLKGQSYFWWARRRSVDERRCKAASWADHPASIPSPPRMTCPACPFASPGWVLPAQACVRLGVWSPAGLVDNRRWDAS